MKIEAKDATQPKQSGKDYYMQKGRQEVVEWVESSQAITISGNSDYSTGDTDWEAQKKVWFNEKV